MDLCEFKASLAYKREFRTARAVTQRKPVWRRKSRSKSNNSKILRIENPVTQVSQNNIQIHAIFKIIYLALFSVHWCEGVKSPGSSCKLPCRCWESNPGPLEEQLLTAEPSLQPRVIVFLITMVLQMESGL